MSSGSNPQDQYQFNSDWAKEVAQRVASARSHTDFHFSEEKKGRMIKQVRKQVRETVKETVHRLISG